MPISAWSQLTFSDADAHSYAVLPQLLERIQSGAQWLASPFGQPGWFQELEEWINKAIQNVSLRLTGSFRQLNASASFSLIRFQTTGPAVWFKAVGDPNRHEYAITLRLAELFPQFLPKMMDARPEWNGWLSLEADGTPLSDTDEIGSWETVAAMLARLQILSYSKTDQIIASGARILSTASLAKSIDPFLESILELMSRQTKIPPHVLTEQEMHRLKEQTRCCLDKLLDLNIPEALGHLDSNPGNIIVSSERCTFLDWAEAYVGNPFFTFHYLTEHFRRTFEDSAQVGKVADAYARVWNQVLPPDMIAKGLQLSAPIAVFAYAVSTNRQTDPEAQSEPRFAAYLRSLARRLNREINSLHSQRWLCLC